MVQPGRVVECGGRVPQPAHGMRPRWVGGSCGDGFQLSETGATVCAADGRLDRGLCRTAWSLGWFSGGVGTGSAGDAGWGHPASMPQLRIQGMRERPERLRRLI